MKPNLDDLYSELSLYNHKVQNRVEFSQVDSFGVVHNLQYPFFIEWARTDYLFSIGLPVNNRTFTIDTPLMTVFSEIHYFASLKFTELYTVYTRVDWVKNTSLSFRNIILNNRNEIIVFSSSVLVYVDSQTGLKTLIPNHIRDFISKYEQDLKLN